VKTFHPFLLHPVVVGAGCEQEGEGASNRAKEQGASNFGTSKIGASLDTASTRYVPVTDLVYLCIFPNHRVESGLASQYGLGRYLRHFVDVRALR